MAQILKISIRDYHSFLSIFWWDYYDRKSCKQWDYKVHVLIVEWKCSNMVPLFMPNAPYFYCINNITSYVRYRVMVWCVAPGLLIDTPRDRVDIINSMALCNLSSNVWKLSREKGKTNQENMVGRLICGETFDDMEENCHCTL